MAMENPPLAVGVVEAAAMLRVGVGRMRQLLRDGELPSISLGPKSTKVSIAALQDWLRRQETAKAG
jgi:excisionase family DNA binding protein